MTATDRLLEKCLACDTIADLFPLMKDWSVEDLQKLMAEVDEFYAICTKATSDGYAQMATKPEYFFNKANSKVLDQAWADISIKALGICSGITSVAIFYLEQRGIKVPCPELGS